MIDANRTNRLPIMERASALARRMPAPFDLPLPLLALALLSIALIGALTFEIQEREKLFVMLGLCAASLGVMIIITPPIGLLALIFATAVIRMKVSTGTESPIVASLGVGSILLVGWLAHQWLNHRPVIRLPRSVALPAACFSAATVISMLWGQATLDPRVQYPPNFYQVQIAATWLTIVSVGLLFIGADLLRDRLLRTILVSTIVAMGMLALPFRAAALSVPMLSTGGLFGMWFVAVAWSQALVNRRLPDPLRVVLGVGAVGWLMMSFFVEGEWISGWIPALVAFLAVTLVARPRLGWIMILIAVLIGAAYYSVFYKILVTDQMAEGSIGGEFGRTEMWQRGLSVIGDHLLFGTGPGGYALYYVTFIPNQAMSTHSNAVDILAQQGIVGLISFVALLVGLWRLGRHSGARLNHDDDRALHAAVTGALPAVIVSLFLGDWFIPFIYNQTIAGFDHSVYSWLMLAALCGLYASQRERQVVHA